MAKHRKNPTFEWPFLRTLSNGRKARITPKDAEFCQVYFSQRTFFGVSARSLLIRSFLSSDRKMHHNTRKRDFSVAFQKTAYK